MLKNYLKLALKVLSRRKFFTFISLFGISVTIMILMLVFSFLDSEVGANAPMSQKDKMIHLQTVYLKLFVEDTLWTIDSSIIDGQTYLDSSYQIELNNRSTSAASASFTFLDKYFREVPNVDAYSFYSVGHSDDLFINTKKLTLQSIYTDRSYWDIFDFEFIEGRGFSQDEIDNGRQVAIISEHMAEAYFGEEKNVLNKEIAIKEKVYSVIGLIKDVPKSKYFLSADLYLPYTLMESDNLTNPFFLGSFESTFLASSPQLISTTISEIEAIASRIDMPDPEQFNKVEVYPNTYTKLLVEEIFDQYPEEDTKISLFILAIALFIGLIMLLPTLNLININVTRILERSSEIGVRKAFGADQRNLFIQFIFENLILTILGGVLGFVLAFAAIRIINDSKVLEETILLFNYRILLYALAACLLFGLLSGLIPAIRMSRLPIVQSLNRQVK